MVHLEFLEKIFDIYLGAPVNRNDQLRGGSRVEIKAELLALKELEGSASTVQAAINQSINKINQSISRLFRFNG